MAGTYKLKKVNRDISWLSFNDRVLQEANDPSVPLIERIRFLGIFSSNRDEFFKVRVASLHRMLDMDKNLVSYDEKPEEVLKRIQKITLLQQKSYNETYQKLLEEMRQNNIFFLDETQLKPGQKVFVNNYFREKVRPALVPLMLSNKREFPLLRDKTPYLAIHLKGEKDPDKPKYALIEIPSELPRFLPLPGNDERTELMFIDDVIRLHLKEIFSIFEYNEIGAYSFKITRDSELDIDDDISTSIMEKLSRSIEMRKVGEPIRFVYDKTMPRDLLKHLLRRLEIDEAEIIIPSSKYHNFKDFLKFPDLGRKDLLYPESLPIPHPDLENKKSLLQAIIQKDVLLSFPYLKFEHIIDLLREAAIDPKVTFIYINLYRVAKDSKVINALENAARNGKRVVVIVELRARFDEQNNMFWANHLQDAGVKVIFGVPGLKVHSKLILIGKKDGGEEKLIAHVGTGNFNENTARLYSDFSLLTANPAISKEVNRVFKFLQSNYERSIFRNLMVSPFNMRRNLYEMIDQEIRNAKAKKPAWITLKLNNLVDDGLIRKLYQASQAGVKIECIVRGTCGIVAGVKGLSSNIRIVSIIDRYLEHARVLIFGNAGDPLYFLSSADWMLRNIEFRVEVGVPIYDPQIKESLQRMIDLQLHDNTKSRIIDKNLDNRYFTFEGDKIRAQEMTYENFRDGKL